MTFQLVRPENGGSTWGTVRLLRDGNQIAQFACNHPDVCSEPVTRNFNNPRPAQPGAVLRYDFTCTGDPTTPDVDECAAPNAFKATIEINYERAPSP